MRDFETLFDLGEEPAVADAAMARYGKLGFPEPPATRPWIYANFVQSVDGIVSLLGDEASGGEISGSAEDRWLMDLLRAHADAVILGMGTLRAERRMQRPSARGPVFRIVDEQLLQLRKRLGRGRERNVLVSAACDFTLSDYAVFDGVKVDATVIAPHDGARCLAGQGSSTVDIIGVDASPGGIDLSQAIAALRDRYGVRYLLCEGGPALYGSLLAAGLIDEKFLTVSPIEVGAESSNGPRPTILPNLGLSKSDAVHWRWLSCRKVGDHQFHRFRRDLSAR
jgi:riboflavin biosynthesis pyrimidine reductase